MNVMEVEQRNNAILNAFSRWKKGAERMTGEELIFICVYYGMKYPEAMHKVIYSDGPEKCRATIKSQKEWAAVFSTLAQLRGLKI